MGSNNSQFNSGGIFCETFCIVLQYQYWIYHQQEKYSQKIYKTASLTASIVRCSVAWTIQGNYKKQENTMNKKVKTLKEELL